MPLIRCIQCGKVMSSDPEVTDFTHCDCGAAVDENCFPYMPGTLREFNVGNLPLPIVHQGFSFQPPGAIEGDYPEQILTIEPI